MRKVRQNIVVNKLELEGILIFKDNPIQADHRTFVSAKLMKKVQETYIYLIIQSKQNRCINQYFFKKSTQKLRE